MSADEDLAQEESIRQRQDDELLSITAIYPNEVKDLRSEKAWNTWKPLELLIAVSVDGDSSENEVTTKADIYVRCSERYPNAVPFIDIKNTKGLSIQDAMQLKRELLTFAKDNIGREMLLDFIQFTESFLYDHKKPHYKSFYEEMVHNQQLQQKQLAEELMQKQEVEKLAVQQKLLAIEQEKNRKLEALRNAQKKSRVQPDASSTVKSSTDSNRNQFQRSRSLSESNCKDVCIGTIRTTLKFNNGKKELSVFCGQCVSHNRRGCVVYYGMETTTGDLVTITKWTLQWAGSQKWKSEELETIKKEQDIFIKQLYSIEQEFRTLKQLRHKNIVLYLGFNYIQKKDKILIFLLQEYVPGSSLAQMANGISLSINQLQLYTRYILHALHYLHENSVVHKNIRDTSIFICRDGLVKLSDYSLDKKLYDLYRSFTNESEIDFYPPTIGKGGKKSDIYRLGVILLSLSTSQISKDATFHIPQSLNPSFRDFLTKCLIHDEQERWSADQLLAHPFVVFSSLHYVLPKESEIKCAVDDDDYPEIPSLKSVSSCASRLLSEFEIMKYLAKGGFGYVLKVRNKLDSRVYALKRIPLNPTNKLLDKKIKREVKLLSRLNHENIVRYYNSWIEESPTQYFEADDEPNKPELNKDWELSATSSLVQWDMRNNDKDDALSSDDDDEDYDLSFAFRQDSNSSSSIVFEGGDDENHISDEENNDNLKVKYPKSKSKVQRFMYIQMEFCEKSTLRTAIDQGLYKDVPLLWRLFREIVEGLRYIHQQCVIHRDLKPVNIFLDSQDHVKIGDFGLATDVMSKPVMPDLTICTSNSTNLSETLQHSYSDALEDGFRTGNVGTALYVAPEVAESNSKLCYSVKVDIYSLGIIFFEMGYPPPVTAMERVKLIMNLRQPEIILPPDVEEHLSSEMILILNWLLQHDYNKRPNSAELIASDYIPPLLMEETDINNIVRNTTANPKSRTYKNMVEGLFSQEVSAEFDFTYDMDIYKGQSIKNKSSQIFCNVVDTLNGILRKHGAISYSVPTLMPKSSVYTKDTCVYVMDRSGGIVTLPHDLRVPFARHVARREITHLKRFTLEKVYREQQVFGSHPREQYEYAFDIVTPTSCNFMPDAEVLSSVYEIISEFPSLEDKNYTICLNHVSLLKAVILYCGIDLSTETRIYDILGTQKHRSLSKLQLQNLLLDLQIPDKTVTKLTQFIDVNDSLDKVLNIFQPLMQTKGEIGTLTKKSLKELKSIIMLADTFGVRLPMIICPGLCHEVQLFSGVVFQFVCTSKIPKKKAVLDILAAGGRYDKLITLFKGLSEGSRVVNQSAIGVSIAVERIVAAEFDFQPSSGIEFLVHSIELDMSTEKSNLLKELWSLGFSASTFYDKHMTLDDAVDFCRNNSVPNLLIISKAEPGVIKIRIFEREKMSEKKICYPELKDYLLKFSSSSKTETFQVVKVDCQRSFSFSNCSSIMSVMSVRFLPQDKTHNNRKREPNIRSQVIATLQPSSNRIWEIIAVDLKMTVIGSIVSLCDINSSVELIHKTFDNISDLHSKYKKYLFQLAEEICDIKSKKQSSPIILYSLPESNFRVLL